MLRLGQKLVITLIVAAPDDLMYQHLPAHRASPWASSATESTRASWTTRAGIKTAPSNNVEIVLDGC
jgi:hypothetical protein